MPTHDVPVRPSVLSVCVHDAGRSIRDDIRSRTEVLFAELLPPGAPALPSGAAGAGA